MILLRRIADRALLWLIVIGAAMACCDVAAMWPSTRPVPDAAKPIPGFSAKVRGPSVEEVIEYFNRRGPEWSSPPDAVE
jgi:hypothetical protein